MTRELQVQLFASLKEQFGAQVTVHCKGDALTAGDVLQCFLTQHQLPSELAESLRVALNHEYAASTDPVQGDEEIAIIPPVSGG